MRRSVLFSMAVLLFSACTAPAAADPPTDRATEIEAQAGPLAPDPVIATPDEHAAQLAEARATLAHARAVLPEMIARADALGVDCPACARIGLAAPDPAWPETMPADVHDPFAPDLHMRDLVAAVESLPEHERDEVLTVLEIDDVGGDDFDLQEAGPRPTPISDPE